VREIGFVSISDAASVAHQPDNIVEKGELLP
jgi:hypothetical protein